jgi:tRNA N6-adenosine threonylcarbamoyltransferase
MKKYPIILAIDTSCDDTSMAITQGSKVLSNIIASQNHIHAKYGGVYPLAAKLEHHKLINPTYKKALQISQIKPNQIDAIAVTVGPGLAIALEVGISFAKSLSLELKKPLIAVNHMKGHLYSHMAKNSQANPKFENHKYPAIALLVSGGHSDLIYLDSSNKLKKVGQTIDDAAGECLDKVARLLDLGYPGAAAMEKIAKSGDPKKYQFPLPMTQSQNFNYSFSGLKTAGRHMIKKLKSPPFQGGEVPQSETEGVLSKAKIQDLAASFQNAVFIALIYKLKKAINKYPVKELWLGGGVTNNMQLRKQLRNFCKMNNLTFRYPKNKKLFSDNAAMISIAAYFQYQNQNFVKKIDTLHRQPRLSI